MSSSRSSPGLHVPPEHVDGLCDVSLDELRSADPAINGGAWKAAYPILWSAGGRIAARLLSGAQWDEQRKDAVAQAIGELCEGVITGKPESYNHLASFRDLVGMTQTIVRRRIVDFHRHQFRSKEDAVEELPEIATIEEAGLLTATEAKELIAALDPPKPALFMDRFFGGLTTREVAAKHGMPHGTVLTHFAQGLKLLNEWMKGLGQ